MNNPNTDTEIFDVFLCHNTEDKDEIRGMADKLINRQIKPWLDEREIRPGTSWQDALEEQIELVNSAAVFVGGNGLGPWQRQEIRAFISEFINRNCPVIPVILQSTIKEPPLPIFLKHLKYIDFRKPIPNPLEQLIWGITGNKPTTDDLYKQETTIQLELVKGAKKQILEIRVNGNLEDLSPEDIDELIADIKEIINISNDIKNTMNRPGSIRLFLELTPEDADKIFDASKNGQLESLGVTHARLYPSLADLPSVEERDQLLILLNRVQEFWVDGLFKQSLHHEVLILLGKRTMDEAVEPPWNRTVELPKQRRQLSLSDTRIETVFDATGLLLILGEPGSGKTTTLLELVTILIARAKSDAKERIPVVLNLSNWKKPQTLAEWITDRLSNIYSVPRQIALRWLDKGYLIPLLDGLDEVKTEHQADCVEAINTYITQAEPAGLVVCCRLTEYQWLPEHLKLNGAICIEPLNRAQVDQYFAAVGSEFESLRMAIQEDTALQELAESPLMLNIMSMTYQSASPESFNAGSLSLEDRRTQIFAAYIDKMFQRKAATSQIFPKERVIYWLAWLAKGMAEHSQSVFFVENLQPNWLDGWKQRATYRAISSLLFGLMAGLMLALVIELFIRSEPSIIDGLILVQMGGVIGALTGVLSGGLNVELFSGSIIGTLNDIKRFETISWSWKSFSGQISNDFSKYGWLIGLIIVSAFLKWYPLVLVLYLWTAWYFIKNFVDDIREDKTDLNHGIKQALIILAGAFIIILLIIGVIELAINETSGALIIGTSIGLSLALIPALIKGFSDKKVEDKKHPNQGITLTLKNSLYVFLFTGFIFSLVYGLIGLKVGLFSGIFLGLIIALTCGLGAVIKHYSLRLALCVNGNIPFKFIPFLDYCAKLILLKKVGGGYIFIHRMLLEYFSGLAIKKPY